MSLYGEAFRVAVTGFSVVFVTLIVLAFSVKLMSFFARMAGGKKGGK